MRIARLAGFPLALCLASACGPAPSPESADSEWPSGTDTSRTPRSSAAEPPVISLAPPAPSKPPAFPIPGDFKADLVWSDGADLLVVSGWPHDGVKRVERSGAALDGRAPRDVTGIAGRGVGPSADVILVGEKGETARLRDGAWDFSLAPALDGEGLAAAAFDLSGRALIAGRHRALYAHQGDTWSTYPYPSSGVDAAALVVAPDGTAYIVGAHARVLAFAAGAFRDVPLSGLTGDALAKNWTHAWLDPGPMRLWAAAERVLVSIDLRTGAATSRALPMYSLDAMTGVSTPSGGILALAGYSGMGNLLLFDGTAFYAVEGAPRSAKGLAIDAKHAVLHVASYDGLLHLPLAHAAFGTGPGKRVTPR